MRILLKHISIISQNIISDRNMHEYFISLTVCYGKIFIREMTKRPIIIDRINKILISIAFCGKVFLLFFPLSGKARILKVNLKNNRILEIKGGKLKSIEDGDRGSGPVKCW